MSCGSRQALDTISKVLEECDNGIMRDNAEDGLLVKKHGDRSQLRYLFTGSERVSSDLEKACHDAACVFSAVIGSCPIVHRHG